jgi:hypothetical protein
MPAPTTVRPHRSSSRARRAPLVGLLAAAGVAAAVPLWFAFRPPATVDLEVANPTDRRVDVSVRSADEEAIVQVGSVAPGDTYRFHEVLDQGEDWVITFTAGGTMGGSVEATAGDLDADDWSVEVPAEVEQQLAAAGVPPSP